MAGVGSHWLGLALTGLGLQPLVWDSRHCLGKSYCLKLFSSHCIGWKHRQTQLVLGTKLAIQASAIWLLNPNMAVTASHRGHREFQPCPAPEKDIWSWQSFLNHPSDMSIKSTGKTTQIVLFECMKKFKSINTFSLRPRFIQKVGCTLVKVFLWTI